jgi:hypothetical protein
MNLETKQEIESIKQKIYDYFLNKNDNHIPLKNLTSLSYSKSKYVWQNRGIFSYKNRGLKNKNLKYSPIEPFDEWLKSF